MPNSQFSSEPRELLSRDVGKGGTLGSASASDENWELGIGQIAAMSLYSPAELEGREESAQFPIPNSHPSRANRYLAMLEKVALSDQPLPRMRIENWELGIGQIAAMSLYSPAELEGREESDQCSIPNSHPSRANCYLAMLEKVALSDQPQPLSRMRV